jgi:hypothetical protein
MERAYLAQSFRARAAQLLSWLTGIQHQERQQQTVQTDRQVFDGLTRGTDDPDNRRQPQPPGQAQQRFSGRAVGSDGPDDVRLPREMGPAAGGDAAALLEARLEANRARHEQVDAMQGPAQERLAAQLQALQERLQAQQRAQQQSRSRGQGMGW